jgi:hypothetical protein
VTVCGGASRWIVWWWVEKRLAVWVAGARIAAEMADIDGVTTEESLELLLIRGVT